MSFKPVISVKNVSVRYRNIHAVENVDLEVRAGEIFGLMGVNGAGKTSLIKTFLALRSPDAGTVRIFGNDPSLHLTRMQLSYLPERFSPPWFLTGLGFIRFSAGLYGRVPDEKTIMAAAERIALDPGVLKRRVHTYSKGMRQKTGMLASFLAERPLLILDEPMGGLDPLARSLVKDIMMEQRKAGRTLFLSSHILADMDEMCDRVALMHKGRIDFTGTPAALKARAGKDTLEQAFLHSIVQKTAA
ncbi:MAG: ABC transporter ATP-binding protein [Alphaproteobacteria bacterium]